MKFSKGRFELPSLNEGHEEKVGEHERKEAERRRKSERKGKKGGVGVRKRGYM